MLVHLLTLVLGLLQLVQAAPSHQFKVAPGTIPQYVARYAPIIHLYNEERYLPYGIDSFVKHFVATDENGKNLTDPLKIQDLERLGALNYDQNDLYLTALQDFDNDPDWITGVHSIPDIESGRLKDAPAVVIVVDKGGGWVDAFWFYFYSFNLGPFVMGGGPYGNHVGDWEHSLVRFYRGEPQIVWMSAHGGGSAYHFKAMEKLDIDPDRPVLFSARGTHANYASVGQHSHDIPFYMLSDFTDRGPLWDPRENYLAYNYDGNKVTFANGSVAGREKNFGDWLSFLGHWGDKKLIPSDPRQKFHPFEWRYIDGPLGPLTKNLMRYGVCQRSKWWNFLGTCKVRRTLQMGEGVESEGGNCARIFDKIVPGIIRWILDLVTWRGWACTLIDKFFG